MIKIKSLLNPYKGLPKEIYVIFISRVINSIGGFVYPLMTLILTEKIGLSESAAGGYITILSLLGAPSIILGGKLVDAIGRKKIILISQGLGATALISCGFMKPNLTLTYLLGLSSLLYALSAPAYDALLADLTTPENRKGAYSLTYMGWNLGFSIGPLIGGFLFKKYLPLVFIVDGFTTLISLVLVMIYIKETVNSSSKEITEDRQLEKSVEGSVFKVLFERPILIYFALTMLIFQFEYSQWGFTLPLQLKEFFKSSGAAYYGVLASFNGLIVILFTPLISKLTHSIKAIKVVAGGGLCYAAAFGMLAFVKVIPFFFISVFIMTIGEIMISINASTFIANHTPASHRGRVSSILPMISGAGYTFGPMIMGSFITGSSIASGWILIGCLGIISTALMRVLSYVDSKNTAVI